MLDSMLERLEGVKKRPETNPGMHLNLGCGPSFFNGFLNIDKFHSDDKVLKYCLSDLPFEKGSIETIYSSHALEHLPIRTAKLAVKRWGEILRPGGQLYLAIPDLGEILRKVLEGGQNFDWYMYTLFGYQVDPSKYSPAQQGHGGRTAVARPYPTISHKIGPKRLPQAL